MLKRLIVLLVLICTLMLSACSQPNKYGLSFTAGNKTSVDYIFYNDERVVYVVGGIMTVGEGESAELLEIVLNRGEITVDAILEAAKEDADNGDIEYESYPDGSVEYHYDGFDIIKLNTHLGNRDVYFVPSSMSYYDVTNP